jgi:hypothetical protein
MAVKGSFIEAMFPFDPKPSSKDQKSPPSTPIKPQIPNHLPDRENRRDLNVYLEATANVRPTLLGC